MPQIGANFQFTSRQPNFERDQFDTVAHMAECTICDEGHICYCLETHKTYRFRTKDDNGNTKTYDNSEGGLGYWEEFQPGGGGGEGTIIGATIGGNPVTESGGVLQLPAYPTVPINKIKVDGESSDLPINDDGRVVIPSTPVKGIKTNNGTTLTPDSNNGIVTLPPIPDASTADTMQYGDSNSYSNGSIGKALKDIRKPGASLNSNFKYAVSRSGDPSLTECLNAMWDELHPVETTDPTPVSPTVVDLDGYDETDDSFTYNDDIIYIYGVSNTSKIVYSDNGTDYAVFKVNDVDKYIRYEITESGGTVTYTCEDVYTLNDLPSEARKLFEISKYAAVKIITGTKTDYFYKGRYSVFVDSDNRPMQNDFYEATESNTTVNYALFKSNDNGDLYLYKLSTPFYKFQAKITSNDANYAVYDAHFGASSADKISFTNTNTGLISTNVQEAISEVVNKIGYTYNTSGPIATNPTKNQYYDLTGSAISSLDISGVDVENTNEILILFLTSSNGCSLTLKYSSSPKPPQRIIGSTSLANSQVYIMSIIRGVICIVEAPIYVQPVSNS